MPFANFIHYRGSSNRIDTIPNLILADRSGHWQTTTIVAIISNLQVSITQLDLNDSPGNAKVKYGSDAIYLTKEKCITGIFNTAMGFEEIEHTADHALKVYGKDLGGLFISAAQGMTSLMMADISGVSGEIAKAVKLETIDTESLLVEWLSELAYWAEAEMLVFSTFKIHTITATDIDASAMGARVAALEKNIKAVTYHNLNIVKTRQGLEATITFDV
ncbi:MAG: archease [Desulfobacterales bacterium]